MYIAYSMDKLAKNTDSIVGPLGTFVKIIGTLLAFSAVGRVLTFIGSSFTAITSAIKTAIIKIKIRHIFFSKIFLMSNIHAPTRNM